MGWSERLVHIDWDCSGFMVNSFGGRLRLCLWNLWSRHGHVFSVSLLLSNDDRAVKYGKDKNKVVGTLREVIRLFMRLYEESKVQSGLICRYSFVSAARLDDNRWCCGGVIFAH